MTGRPRLSEKNLAPTPNATVFACSQSAKAAFAAKGSGASLDEIARAAGVGIGTLYRHFPTRDALIEAVYRNETENLAHAAAELADAAAPVEALRKWMLLFIDYMATKHGMSEALDSIVGGGSELRAVSGARVAKAVAMLVDRAMASGAIEPDIEPLDFLRALAGIAYANADANWKTSAQRLVNILIAGTRKRKREF